MNQTIKQQPEVVNGLYRDFTVYLALDPDASFLADRYSYTYHVVTPTGVVFKGYSFCPSPLLYRETDIVDELLFWICLRPGDTDADYFESYTEEQLAWTNSFECEIIGSELCE